MPPRLSSLPLAAALLAPGCPGEAPRPSSGADAPADAPEPAPAPASPRALVEGPAPAPAPELAASDADAPAAADDSTATTAEPGPPAQAGPPLRLWTDFRVSRDTSASARVQGAHERRDAIVGELFSAAGLTFPPRELLLRAYKEERELEVWASDRRGAPLTHVTTYKICALSGRPGPKKLEGDGQVPEGFYTLDYFNKRSAYHLSMRVSYPNHRDRKLRSTGSAIMIHGDCVSIGCLAMSDERIEELWVMVTALPEGQRAAVHLFPGRDLDGFIARAHDPELAAFWRNLAEGEAAFERDKRPPKIGSTADGTYTFR